MSLSTIIVIVASAFWLMILYHVILTIAGLIHRAQTSPPETSAQYPSVDILIPPTMKGVFCFTLWTQ
jgi:hypothetical protein